MKTTFLQLVVGGVIGGLLSACTPGVGMDQVSSVPCTRYTYNDKIQNWVNAAGQPVECSVADRTNIFPHLPGQGCEFWQKQFAHDPAVKMAEVVLHTGSTPRPRKYCVLQRYFKKGPSGQVLLMGDYCLKQVVSGKEYRHISCPKKAQKSGK